MPFCSSSAVTVRPPGALSERVSVPSGEPSGPRAVSPPPTLSRSLPLYASDMTTVCGVMIVNALASVPPVPLGLVTVTSRAPAEASAAIVKVAVSLAAERTVTPVAVIPTPAFTEAPFAKPLPSIVTATAEPDCP